MGVAAEDAWQSGDDTQECTAGDQIHCFAFPVVGGVGCVSGRNLSDVLGNLQIPHNVIVVLRILAKYSKKPVQHSMFLWRGNMFRFKIVGHKFIPPCRGTG
jgi:hypothetical protein